VLCWLLPVCSGWLWVVLLMSESELLATAGMDALVSFFADEQEACASSS
jgi:hypothetical protein